MALWSSGWKWSDGTKWAGGAIAAIQAFASLIDRSAYFVSVKIVETSTGSTTAPPSILNILSEVGIRPQLPSHYEAFIDRNDKTQYIAVVLTQPFPSSITESLTTESDISIGTEADPAEDIVVELTRPFTINRIHGLISQRSRIQPTG